MLIFLDLCAIAPLHPLAMSLKLKNTNSNFLCFMAINLGVLLIHIEFYNFPNLHFDLHII